LAGVLKPAKRFLVLTAQVVVPSDIVDAVSMVFNAQSVRMFKGLGEGGQSSSASVITLKPAIRYQFKTGQRDWPET
jgi:hypothetical protein